MQKQRERSRKSSKFKAGEKTPAPPSRQATVFTGYTESQTRSSVAGIIVDEREKDSAEENTECFLITEKTPFYPESGGQEGDTGVIQGENWSFRVAGTRKSEKTIMHYGKTEKGVIKNGDSSLLSVDLRLRALSAANHTATHLLQSGLKKILGEHVRQAGSLVTPRGLRFDFCHNSKLTRAETEEAENFVNEIIRENIPVRTSVMPLNDALKAGAAFLPGEKYEEKARVVESGTYSMELCGGIHAAATGNIGIFIIKSESSIASGIRRIEALTGPYALKLISEQRALLDKTAEILKATPAETPRRAEILLQTSKKLEKQIPVFKKSSGIPDINDILNKTEKIENIPVIIHRAENIPPAELEPLADEIRKASGSVLCVLTSTEKGRVHIITSATKDLVAKGINAGSIAKETAISLEGGGGGRPDFARAGGKNPGRLEEALNRVPEMIRKQIRGTASS